MQNYEIEYQRWLASPILSENEREELSLISDDLAAQELRFSSPMSFGTAGLRADMNLGVGCMNRFTVARVTRAIASIINEMGASARGVAIAYDSRNNSRLFAEVSASVLASEGIKVYIFDGIRPTPELSFAVMELSCIAGINITASHNPKEYNGYKLYWQDGAQVSPELADTVAERMLETEVLSDEGTSSFDALFATGKIELLSSDFDERYLNAVLKTSISPEYITDALDSLKVVYTPLHGAGYKLVPEIFRRAGLPSLYTVDTQMIPDGDFPTVRKPNPEYPDAFAIGIEIANKVGSDLVIATDPDADRIGVMARDNDGEFKTISGNRMGALLLDYVIREKRRKGSLSDNSYCVKSIVSTDMAYKIAEKNGVRLHDVLTGFKFIGEVINSYTESGVKNAFLLGFEESYGYLLGEYARDKDAVGAALIILEMTAYYTGRGMTLCDALRALYLEYGYYAEKTVEVYMEGLDGIARRKRIMQSLRDNAPTEISSIPVSSIGDYKTSLITNLESGDTEVISQPPSDVLSYTLQNGDKVIIRPSGTEPNIKIYMLASGASSEEIETKISEYEIGVKRLMQD